MKRQEMAGAMVTVRKIRPAHVRDAPVCAELTRNDRENGCVLPFTVPYGQLTSGEQEGLLIKTVDFDTTTYMFLSA